MQFTQMIPAEGWFAVYREQDSSVRFQRLVCWALGDGQVWGMIAKNGVSSCEEDDGFDRYVHETKIYKVRQEFSPPPGLHSSIKEDLVSAIQQLGAPTLSEITEATNRDRGNTYRQLKTLIDVGVVALIKDSYPQRYVLVESGVQTE